MNDTMMFWFASFGLFLVFIFLVLREYRAIRMMVPGHPERGYYFFNIFFFFCTACVALFVGYVIQEDRLKLMSHVPEYPSGRYAIERGGFFDTGNWVYVSHDTPADISAFYQNYARARGWKTIVDEDNGTLRLSFSLRDGNFFLTLRPEDGVTVLYFSTMGEVRVVTIPAKN